MDEETKTMLKQLLQQNEKCLEDNQQLREQIWLLLSEIRRLQEKSK